MMNCCSVNDLDKVFGKTVARADLKRYLKKGLDKRARTLVRLLSDRNINDATIMEVGPGIGSLHLELIKSGAASAVGYDASHAYIEAAESLAYRMGFQGKVEYHVADFVDDGVIPEAADIVILDRVVCCYPDMCTLLSKSVRQASRLYALSYPKVNWWMHLGRLILNVGAWTIRKRYRFFLHSPQDITRVIRSAGLVPIHQTTSGIWHIAVFQRP